MSCIIHVCKCLFKAQKEYKKYTHKSNVANITSLLRLPLKWVISEALIPWPGVQNFVKAFDIL